MFFAALTRKKYSTIDLKKIAIPLKRKMAKYTPRYWLLSQPQWSAAHQLSQ